MVLNEWLKFISFSKQNINQTKNNKAEKIQHNISEKQKAQLAQDVAAWELTNGKLETQFPDQEPLTTIQLAKAAKMLLTHPTLKFIFETHGQPIKDRKLQVLAKALNTIFSKIKLKDQSYPFFDKHIRELVTILFTKKTNLSGKEVYDLLGSARIYSLIHRFCTQSVPTTLAVDFDEILSDKNATNSQLARVGTKDERFVLRMLRTALSGFKVPILELEPGSFSAETEWISNDKKTRIKIAQEMTQFVINYFEQHPQTQKITIIEPGAGNGEFTSILARMLYENEATRGKVNIILKEYSAKMAEEGKAKFERLAQKLAEEYPAADGKEDETTALSVQNDLGINYVIGSADTSLAEQIVKNPDTFSEINIQEAPVIAAVSTFTFGAMGNLAQEIVKTSLNDLIKDGQAWFVDFSNAPSPQQEQMLVETANNTYSKENEKKIGKLISFFKHFGRLGFSAGLAANYSFWGHDSDQALKIAVWLKESKQQLLYQVSNELELTPFGVTPIANVHDEKNTTTAIVLPGYLQLTIKVQKIK